MDCPPIQQSLLWCEGKASYPGIRRVLYYINKSLILVWPTRTKDEQGRYTTAEYTGNFTLAADANWKRIDVIVTTSGLTSEPQGEKPSQTQLNKLVAVHPGTDKLASAAALYLNNTDSVFLVQNMDGKWVVLGSALYDGKATVSQDYGQGATGTASTPINAEATDVTPCPVYNGLVVTEDGSFMADGSDVNGD